MRSGVGVQLIGLVGMALFFFSYQCRKNQNLFRMQFLSYLCYTVHLLLLGATTGGVSYVVNTFRSLCLASRCAWARSRKMCAAICAMQLAALALTWSGWISLLPVAANIAATLGGYTFDARKIRAVGMFINSPLWIAYNFMVGSWVGMLDEFLSECSIVLSIVRYGWKNLGEGEA